VLSCDRPSGERNAATLALVAALRQEPEDQILRWAREREADPAATPEQLVEVVFALRAESTLATYGAAKQMVPRLFDRFPSHPEVRLLRANEHAGAGRWAEARECLAGVEPSDFDASRAQHIHHLRALTALEEGRFEEMTENLAAARSVEGRCDLGSLEEMAQSLSSGREEGSREASPLGALVAALRAADACFARGDLAGAMGVLDCPLVWAAHELQSLARLAEAQLHLGAGSRVERLRMLAALGTLLDEWDETPQRNPREVVFPGAWSAARIASVAARARAWMDALFEVREPSPPAS
jgi:hypothetical protein